MSLKDLVTKTRLTYLLGLIAATIVAQFNDDKAYAKGLKDALVASDVAFTHEGFNSGAKTDVGAALAELFAKQSGAEISFEKLQSPNDGKLASYRFTKGTGVGATTMDIDIDKDYVNNIIGIVSQNGEGETGTFLKVNTAPKGDETPVYEYVDVSGLVEYLTLGDQSGKVVTLNISTDHKITADIADKAVTKAKLEQSVQESLAKADSALQASDFDEVSEEDLQSAWTTAMTNAKQAYEQEHS